MDLAHLFSCLVPAGKHAETEEVLRGTQLPLSGKMFEMLAEVFAASEKECTIPIRFLMAPDGTQQNEVRAELIQLIREPSLDKSLALARRLYQVTTHRSGLGLLFLMFGEVGGERKCVISRFPANQGVLAEPHTDTLEIEFVERVFMKNAATYKAALYKGSSFDEHFWDGTVVDKQKIGGHDTAADYWIREFLHSEFRTTAPAGSRRLARALRDAARSTSILEVKQEIVSATSLIPRLAGRPVSVASLLDHFNLSDASRAAIKTHLPGDHVLDSVFNLDAAEFKRHAAFRAVEIDNEGVLMAPAETFDDVFNREVVDETQGTVRFSTVGRVVDESLKARR